MGWGIELESAMAKVLELGKDLLAKRALDQKLFLKL
jgi:hypothetical protein